MNNYAVLQNVAPLNWQNEAAGVQIQITVASWPISNARLKCDFQKLSVSGAAFFLAQLFGGGWASCLHNPLSRRGDQPLTD